MTSLEDYIFSHGKKYRSVVLPRDIQRGSISDCYDTCMLNAMRERRYRYVEGLAQNPGRPGEWILHSWLTDGEFAFDPTWLATDPDKKEIAIPIAYIGIELDLLKVIAFVRATEYKGIFANAWRDPARARKVLATIPCDKIK